MYIEIFTNNALHTEFAALFFSCLTLLLQTAKTPPLIVFAFIMFLIGIIVPVLVVGVSVLNWFKNQSLLKNGEPATAKILKIWETGATLNDQPQIGMLLDVYPKDRPSFQSEAKRFVSILKIPLIQVGCSVEVRFDPHDTSRIAVVL
jgi:hypothetical protein